MLTVDQSSFAGKTSGAPYYGSYSISIEGGDSLSCCDATKALTFSYALLNQCNEPSAIGFFDKDALFSEEESGQPVVGEIQLDVSLYQDSPPKRYNIDLAQIDSNEFGCGLSKVEL